MERKEFETKAIADYKELVEMVSSMEFVEALKHLNGYNLDVDVHLYNGGIHTNTTMRFDCNFKSICATIFQTKENKCEVYESIEIYDENGTQLAAQFIPSFVKYVWKAECSDGAFEDCSKKEFDTKEECYNDMRNAALEKMKWNTEFVEDLEELASDEYIGYEVHFNQNYITHNSYSGLYTYTIETITK